MDSEMVLADSDGSVRKFRELLLAYLLAANYPPWPGADGLAVDDVLSTYAQACARGLVPGPGELRNRHPDLAEQVQLFFASNPVPGKSTL
jgi:hypothetical protein